MAILKKEKELSFNVTSDYQSKFMIPILKNAIVKAEDEWDDYHEAYHFTKLVCDIGRTKRINVEYHYLLRDKDCVGIAMIRYGSTKPNDLSLPSNINIKEHSVVLNYFHIAPEGRSNGQKWLKDIILPYYKEKGFSTLYVKTSHEKAFSLYARLGRELDYYYTNSDNYLYKREGKIFEISF